MADFCVCSACGSDLRGPIIPVESRHHYGGHQVCRYECGGEPPYSRMIGIYDIERDRTAAWVCPDCGTKEMRDG